MPRIELGSLGSSEGGVSEAQSVDLSRDLDYTYPREMDLTPKSALHRRLLTRIMERARTSNEKMSDRYSDWAKLDETMTAYIPQDQKERDITDADDRRPTSIVVPLSYLNLEVITTYMMSTFLDQTLIEYQGVGSEDVLGALLLERVIQHQVDRSNIGLALHTQFRDAFLYGLGIATPVWERRFAKRKVEVTVPDFLGTGGTIPTGEFKTQDFLQYEGHQLENIEPYLYLPDPNVPGGHDVQKGEFVGWVQQMSFIQLMSLERDSANGYFNVRYLRTLDGRSTLRENQDGRGKKTFTNERSSNKQLPGTRPFDVIIMYIDLIPSEWGLGPEEYPEKWMFRLAADRVIISAQPLGLNHNMFPVTVMAPDFDGYSVAPISRTEVGYPAQRVADFLFNSHIANVRKTLNGMFVVDPSVIEMRDILNPGPGKIIRKRPNAWNKNLGDAIIQLPVTDVTQGHLKDLNVVSDLMQRVSGASDALQGVIRDQGERVSATEARDSRIGAVSRLQKAARIISMQAIRPMGTMLASQTQQLMEQASWIRLGGRYEEELRRDLELPDDDLFRVAAQDIDVLYDVVPHDGVMQGGADENALTQMMQTVAQSPTLSQGYDQFRLFSHVMRAIGVKNVDDFRIKVVSDQKAQEQAQAGNIVPIGGG